MRIIPVQTGIQSEGVSLRLVLASTSPRRLDLLRRIGIEPDRIIGPDIDEAPRPGELPRVYATRMAGEKARAIARAEGEIILAGDTTVAVGRRILNKPADADDHRQMLTLLSGRRHHVLSSVCVIDASGTAHTRTTDSIVTFKRLSDAELAWYLASGEGEGKAGGYAIQGRAESLVRFQAGSHSGIVGLPLFETRALLIASGYALG